MTGIETVLASGFQTAAVLTLVLPARGAGGRGDLVRRAVAPRHGRTLRPAAAPADPPAQLMLT